MTLFEFLNSFIIDEINIVSFYVIKMPINDTSDFFIDDLSIRCRHLCRRFSFSFLVLALLPHKFWTASSTVHRLGCFCVYFNNMGFCMLIYKDREKNEQIFTTAELATDNLLIRRS